MTSTPAPKSTSDQHPDNYDASRYKPAFTTADLAIFTIRDGALSILLVLRADEPYKDHWALPGGFLDVDEDEDVEETAWRELTEETGLTRETGHLEQLKTYTRKGRDPRARITSVAHVALAPNLPDPKAGSDAREARWWPIEDVFLMLGPTGSGKMRRIYDALENGEPGLPLAFDHAEIILDALERVRSKFEYTTLALQFAPEQFTMSDIRRIYEAVWMQPVDLSNLTRKFLKVKDAVTPTDQKRDAGVEGGRRPLLYTRGTATALQPPFMRPGSVPDADD
jgi:8-oxo-dGTP diphosphatase